MQLAIPIPEPVSIDRIDLPYRQTPELRGFLVNREYADPTLEMCPVAEEVRRDLLEAKALPDRLRIVGKHLHIVAALRTDMYVAGEGRKYIDYEIVALKSEGGPKAVLFLNADDYELMAIAIIGMQAFDDFSTFWREIQGYNEGFSIPGTFGVFLWRNPSRENTPVRLYSPSGDIVFSGIYHYSTAPNGNGRRALYSDDGKDLDDRDLSSIVLEKFPQYWKKSE